MESRTNKLIIIQRIFSNYRKPVFDRLNEKYEFKLLHSQNKSGITQLKTNYSENVFSFRYWKKETNVFLCVLPKLFIYNPDVIIHEFNPSILSLHISYLYVRLFNKKIIVWGHGYNRRVGFNPEKSFKSKIRYWYLKHADAVLVYGQEGKKTLSNFVSEKKIFVAHNTLDTDKLISIRKKNKKRGIEIIKNELGVKHKYNLIFIGRLLKEKHPEILIRLFQNLNKSLQKDVAIHIIGDGEMFEELKNEIKTNKLENNIFLHGKINDDVQSGKYLYISDLLVNPGYVGLSVNHAFCFQTPVVTFKEGYKGIAHSPEIEYVIHNKTGFIADSFEDFSNFITHFISDNKEQEYFKDNIDKLCSKIISISNMLSGIDNSIAYTLKSRI